MLESLLDIFPKSVFLFSASHLKEIQLMHISFNPNSLHLLPMLSSLRKYYICDAGSSYVEATRYVCYGLRINYELSNDEKQDFEGIGNVSQGQFEGRKIRFLY